MGMNKVFGYFIGILSLLIVLVYLVNVLLLYNVKSDVIVAEQIIITYAQVNGGFVDSGSESFPEFYKRTIANCNLENKIAEVNFFPDVGTKVQKGDSFTIAIRPQFFLIVPFSDRKIEFSGDFVERTGISRLYRK